MKNAPKQKDLSRKIDLGIRQGVARALAEHKEKGQSIHVLKNGKIITITAKDIQVKKK
jgi:hypothetical protein